VKRIGTWVALCVLLTGCAHDRLPLRLKLVTPEPELTFVAGASRGLDVVVANEGRKPVRVQRNARLQNMLSCRREGDPPGQWGMGVGSPMEGSVWGGVTDRTPDPADPKYCREYPPETMVLAPGETVTLGTMVEVPAECAAGDAELEVSFHAPDDGRHCAGISFGDTRAIRRRVEIRPPR
jgi:hypothetical protein